MRFVRLSAVHMRGVACLIPFSCIFLPQSCVISILDCAGCSLFSVRHSLFYGCCSAFFHPFSFLDSCWNLRLAAMWASGFLRGSCQSLVSSKRVHPRLQCLSRLVTIRCNGDEWHYLICMRCRVPAQFQYCDGRLEEEMMALC